MLQLLFLPRLSSGHRCSSLRTVLHVPHLTPARVPSKPYCERLQWVVHSYALAYARPDWDASIGSYQIIRYIADIANAIWRL